MAISREQAFGVFEDLIAEGLRPHLTGFRADGSNPYWPEGTEGFFVSARVDTTVRLGVTIEAMQKMQAIAERHGLKPWFSGRSYDGGDETDTWLVVKFEER